MKLSFSDACNLVSRMEAGKVLDTIMPNGLPLRQCSQEYADEIANALEDVMDEFEDELAANDEMETLQ